MDSFKKKRIVHFGWLPGWGSCTGKNGMTMTPFYKLPVKAWPAVDIVRLQWSRHKRKLWCSATCYVTFCTDVPVLFLAMRQLSAPPTYLHSLETERLSRPCFCIRQLSTRLSSTSTGRATNFKRRATHEPSLAWTRVFGGNWAAFWLMHNQMRIQDCPALVLRPSSLRRVLHYLLHGGGCLPRARFDFFLSGAL
jgi:hypothetical protein